MVATVLTSVVAAAAYAAAQVSTEAHARLRAELRTVQHIRAVRETLQDALRNARPPLRLSDPGLTLQDGRLSFVAAGAGPPFDPDYDWLVVVEADTAGLRLLATPVGRAPTTEVAFRVPGVTAWEVRVLPSDGSDWVPEWPPSPAMPRAISIALLRGSEYLGAPLQVALTPLGMPGPQQ